MQSALALSTEPAEAPARRHPLRRLLVVQPDWSSAAMAPARFVAEDARLFLTTYCFGFLAVYLFIA